MSKSDFLRLFDDFLHILWIVGRENSPEIISRGKIVIIVMRKEVLELGELLNDSVINERECQFFILGNIKCEHIFSFQDLRESNSNLQSYRHSIFL